MTIPLRRSVSLFAERMERKLAENDHKGGWKDCSVQTLLARLCEEAAELVESYDVEPTNGSSRVGPREAFAIAAHHLRCAASVLSTLTGFLGTRGAARIAHPDTRNDGGPADEAADVANFAMMIAEVSVNLATAGVRK